ncbi:MAG: hypothetical protein PHT58_00550 [Eubacteriales bacterium]|nr:hypothetical protein [Eubacteriales bacterium]
MTKFLSLLLILLMMLPTATLSEQGGSLVMPQDKAHKASYIEDDDIKTFVNLSDGDRVVLTFDEEGGAYVEWYSLPTRFEVEYLDAQGMVIATQTYTKATYRQLFKVDGCHGVAISAKHNRTQLATLHAVPADFELALSNEQGRCDMLVVLCQVGDESLKMGSVFAQYCGLYGMDVQVCYIRKSTRERFDEAMLSLEAMGVKRSPIFLEREDGGRSDFDGIQNKWNKSETVSALGDVLESSQPRIIVTFDPSKDNENGSERATADFVMLAIERYGVPSVEKLYTLCDEGATHITATTEQLGVIEDAYKMQASQRVYRYVPNSQAQFELYYSTVGADATLDSLVENLDTASFNAFITPTPQPTATPTAIATQEPATPAPTQEPTATPTPTQETAAVPQSYNTNSDNGMIVLLIIGLATLATIATVVVILRKKR